MELTKYYTIALDVGQTFTRSAVLDEQGRILPDSFSIFSTKSAESNEMILENFVRIIKFTINSILHPRFEIKWIGFSFSHAFISKHKENILQEKRLKEAMMQVPSIQGKLSKDCQLHFEENALLFAIGEHILRKNHKANNRVLYLIIGSSLSSACMVQGELNIEYTERLQSQESQNNVNDDYISSRGMVELAKDIGISRENLDLKDLEKMALNGDSRAIKVFELFGEYLGLALKELIIDFSPDEIIIGGNLALSYPLFKESFENTTKMNEIRIKPTKHTSYYIFFGVSERVKRIKFD